jgi:agmatine deiminase
MAAFSPNSPAALGYRMPAEWAPHQATWLSWPRREGISFPDKFDPIPIYWVKMCALLSPGEEVHINTFSDAHEREIITALAQGGLKTGEHIFMHHFPAYEPWCRDHGPIFVKKGDELAVVDWNYNAWGGKYPPHDLDDAVPQHVAKLLGLPLFSPGIVMEGGSIDVNGSGTVLTTEACLLNKNRNPHLSREQIEQYLRDYLGVVNVLWLGEGIVGDDTDGHVDDITRFVDERTVVTAVEDDPQDENYEFLRENRRRLEHMANEKGEPLRIIDLPMPGRVEHEGERLPASYANFYIGNDVLLLPVYRHANDAKAQEILQRCFPSRRVVPIDGTDLIWGLGSFHCVTQQQPR